MQDALILILGPVGLIVVLALVWAGINEAKARKFRERIQQLRQAAQDMGFSFKDDDPELAADLFAGQPGVRLINVMRGEAQGLETIVFDLHRTIVTSNTVMHIQFTLLVFRERDANWPAFSLRPRQFSDRLTGLFGKGKLQLQHDIAFARIYIVESDNEDGVSEIFTEDVRRHFTTKRGLWIEAKDERMVITRGRLLEANDLRAFLEEGFTVRKVLATGEVDVRG